MNVYTKEEHTFVICAYKESKYLPDCIESLQNQTIKSKIILSTSTPNEYIENTAKKYDVQLRINQSEQSIYGETPGISKDWNYAYKQADSKLITLAHQDDVYQPEYLEIALQSINFDM